MKIKVVVHEAEEGGFWGEVPAIPGCASEGDTMEELLSNLHEAIEGCLSVDVVEPKPGGEERILEIPDEVAVRPRFRIPGEIQNDPFSFSPFSEILYLSNVTGLTSSIS
jgi:predicted RNase H-like HicB family nuclease